MRIERLQDLIPDMDDRVQRRQRVLEDHRDTAWPPTVQSTWRHTRDHLPAEQNLPGDKPHLIVK